MSRFFDRVSGFGDDGVTEGGDPDALVGADGVETYVDDAATLRTVVVGSDGLTRGTDDWQTTEDPGEGRGAMFVVTDRRVHAVVGDTRDPDVSGDYVRSIPLEDVADVSYETSLLSTAFVVTDEAGVRFSLDPVDDDGITEVETFVRRSSERWSTVAPLLAEVDDAADRIEDGLAGGDDEDALDTYREMKRRLSEAGDAGSRHDIDVPLLDQRIEAAEETVTAARVRGTCRRALDCLDLPATDADPDDPCGADWDHVAPDRVLTAAEAVETAAEVLDPEMTVAVTVEDDDAESEWTPASVAAAVEGALAVCLDAVDDDDPESRVDRLHSLRDVYRTLVRAVDLLDADRPGLDERHRECIRELAATLSELAAAREDAADDHYDAGTGADDAAREEYEAAIDYVEELRDLDAAHDHDVDLDLDEPVADRLDRLERKAGRTEWEWVGTER